MLALWPILWNGILRFCYGAGVLPDRSLVGAIGGSVTFNRVSSQPFTTLQWNFNGTTIILNYISSSDSLNPAVGYRDRINLDRSSGSLELMNLVLTDSGQYTVTILTPEAVSVDENTKLEVYGKMLCILPLSGNSVNLTCDAAGSIITREWMKDGQLLSTGGNLIISEDKRVLSIDPVKRTDSGEYLCRVSNPVSTADAKHILIVKSEGSLTPGLSAGAIAGIVIGVLLVVGVAVGVAELNYADITQFQKRDGGSVQLGNLGTSSTEYSQVRVNNRPTIPQIGESISMHPMV
uniref:Carcinoembryonic antigen-related cell adhesion molecule 1-like n=1 Tax=Salmo trutta TaxID=8032 RepID=A0A674BS32_SALTR